MTFPGLMAAYGGLLPGPQAQPSEPKHRQILGWPLARREELKPLDLKSKAKTPGSEEGNEKETDDRQADLKINENKNLQPAASQGEIYTLTSSSMSAGGQVTKFDVSPTELNKTTDKDARLKNGDKAGVPKSSLPYHLGSRGWPSGSAMRQAGSARKSRCEENSSPAGNIPVGIAIAQKRGDCGRTRGI